MKKILIIFSLVAFTASLGNAQINDSDFRSKFMFGLKLGTNYSNVYDSEGEQFDADPKFGFIAGAFVAIPIGPMFGIQPEFHFSQKGFKATGSILGSPYEFTRTTNYIDIPLLVSLKPSEALSLLAGFQYSYLLKQKDSFTNAFTTIDQEKEFSNDNIRRNTVGLLAGADVNINHFVIGGRAGWDLFKNNGDGSTTSPRYKNAWYQVTLGYRFFN